jgi:hypothetical protein
MVLSALVASQSDVCEPNCLDDLHVEANHRLYQSRTLTLVEALTESKISVSGGGIWHIKHLQDFSTRPDGLASSNAWSERDMKYILQGAATRLGALRNFELVRRCEQSIVQYLWPSSTVSFFRCCTT